MKKDFTVLILLLILLIIPSEVNAFHTNDLLVESLQNRISNNFSKKYCKAIDNGYSKDEAMRSAIIKTENIITFSFNPMKEFVAKEDLADKISIKVINDCGLSFGLVGKDGINYFKKYFLEINEKTTPNKNLSG